MLVPLKFISFLVIIFTVVSKAMGGNSASAEKDEKEHEIRLISISPNFGLLVPLAPGYLRDYWLTSPQIGMEIGSAFNRVFINLGLSYSELLLDKDRFLSDQKSPNSGHIADGLNLKYLQSFVTIKKDLGPQQRSSFNPEIGISYNHFFNDDLKIYMDKYSEYFRVSRKPMQKLGILCGISYRQKITKQIYYLLQPGFTTFSISRQQNSFSILKSVSSFSEIKNCCSK